MIIDNLCLILLPSPHGPILVEKEKTQVELGNHYYESNNSIPVYQFTPDTLPTEYYLNKVIAGFKNTPTLINKFPTELNQIIKHINTKTPPQINVIVIKENNRYCLIGLSRKA